MMLLHKQVLSNINKLHELIIGSGFGLGLVVSKKQ